MCVPRRSVVGQFRLLAVSGPLPASGAWWWEDAARACGTCRVGVYGRRVGAQTTEAEAVLASLADGMTMAELDRLAGERASTMTETREQAGTLARYVYPERVAAAGQAQLAPGLAALC